MSKTHGTNVHVIDGVTYVEVERKAKFGDKILDLARGVQTVEKAYDAGVYFYEGIVKRYSANWHHITLEPLESEEVTVDTSQASEQVIEMLANLARRVTQLESQLRDTQRNVERQAEDLENARHRINDHSMMFGEFDERTQVINAIRKFYKEEAPMKHTINVNREVELVKIALTGKLRAGKDEVAQHLYIKHGFTRIAFGDALKRNAHEAFPWVSQFSKPRALYQRYGQLMREIEPDVWIRHAERSVRGTIDFRVSTGAEKIGVVVTDLRQFNEYEWARTEGYTIIRVTAPDEVRIARAIKAGDDFTLHDLCHETELAIDSFQVDYEVVNEGSVEELKKKVDEILSEILEV